MKYLNQKIRPLILFGCILFGSPLTALDLKLKIFDPGENKSIGDIPVIVIETGKKYFTDEKGEAIITVPAAGFFTFRAVIPGKGIVQKRLEAQFEGQTLTLLAADGASAQTESVGEEGILVTGNKDKSRISRYNVRLDEIKRMPGSFGEALRGIEMLPGIAAAPFSYNVVIRGAGENANSFLVDELPVPFLYHFIPLDAVVHNDMIKSIDVYTGAYPAKYGDATGGIIAVETIDDVNKFGGHLSFSLWSAKAMFNGKIGEKGYWIGAGKASYFHKTFKSMIDQDVQAPIYQDGQFKTKVNLTKNQDLYFYAFAGKDYWSANLKKDRAWDPTTENPPELGGARISENLGFHTEGIRHIWTPKNRFQNKLTLINTDIIYEIEGKLGTLEADQNITGGYAAVRDEISAELMKDHIFLDLGAEERFFHYYFKGKTFRAIDPTDPNPDFYDTANPDFETVPVNDSFKTNASSGWIMLTMRAGGLEFKPGVRADRFALNGQTVVDPRGTLSYTFPSKTTVVGGAGVYHKIPDLRWVSPTSGNPDLLMERAEHYGLGIEQQYKDWLFKIEGFRHYYTDVAVEDPYITKPISLNEDYISRMTDPVQYIDTEILRPNPARNNDLILYNQPKYYSNDGTGFSEGYEIYIKKSNPPNRKGWYGWVSYTWSRTLFNNHQHIVTEEEKNTVYTADERRIINQYDNTKDAYADFDRTHILNVVYGYKFNPEWLFGMRWKHQTSEPYTEIIGVEKVTYNRDPWNPANDRPIFDPKYSPYKNTKRLKPYHRMDIRIDRFINYSWGYGNVFFEALNVYVRKNETSMAWDSSRPFSATNPSPETGADLTPLIIPAGNQNILIPFFNVGIEVKF